MKRYLKLVLASILTSGFLIGFLAVLAGLLWADMQEAERAAVRPIVEQRLGGIILMVLLSCLLAFAILREAFRAYVLGLRRAASEVEALAQDGSRRLQPDGPSEMQELAVAVNKLAERRQVLERDVEERIRSANRAADEERNRFAALISEIKLGVVVCNRDGRVLLYNPRARDHFAAGAPADGGVPLGLGRSIYTVLDRQLIAHALERVAAGRSGGANFIAATPGGRLLRAQVAPVQAGSDQRAEAVGYLLMLDDITATFESESKRDELLQTLTEGSRGPLGNLRAAAETLHAYPDMPADDRERFFAVIRQEAERLGGRIEDAGREFAAVVKSRWPLEEMRAADLVAAAQRRIGERLEQGLSVEDVPGDLWLRVDSFSLLQAITYLASRLVDEYNVRDLRIRCVAEGAKVHLDLIWSGASMSTETVMQWELDSMSTAGENTPLTVRDVIERCGGEIWLQRERASHRAFFRFLLPAAQAHEVALSVRETLDSRPEFYDFDLFHWAADTGAIDDTPLADLSYTVFDTETTGLNPSQGDEIIQIGAMRIVNRRLLKNECFEQFIDPRMPLPKKSTEITGITPEMLVGQPVIDKVLPAFRAFVGDTVLVAHNAAFDMRFLELKEEATGVRFDRPVLDTLLLSAVIFDSHETHRLEAIAERLGVSIVGRHTAVGDSMVTGEVFLRMIPLLAAKGVRTLREAREASEKTYNARLKY